MFGILGSWSGSVGANGWAVGGKGGGEGRVDIREGEGGGTTP